jgi:hypothetical protein
MMFSLTVWLILILCYLLISVLGLVATVILYLALWIPILFIWGVLVFAICDVIVEYVLSRIG